MDTTAERLTEARRVLAEHCILSSSGPYIQSVTFQPDNLRNNEDRLVIKTWFDIGSTGNPWTFLAVLDGHTSADTSEFTSKHLTKAIYRKLRITINEGDSDDLKPETISKMLRSEVEGFDRQIGKKVKHICKKPWKYGKEAALALIKEGTNEKYLKIAAAGTTLTAVLIDHTKKWMWSVAIGDSSVVLVTRSDEGNIQSRLINKLHSTSTPTEYCRVALDHPKEPLVLYNDRILGSLQVTRSIGDFAFKLPWNFSVNILFGLDLDFGKWQTGGVTQLNHTPPYVGSIPEVDFIDLATLEDPDPDLILYTDGVDNLVSGQFTFRKKQPFKGSVAQVAGELLYRGYSRSRTDYLEEILGHSVDLDWPATCGNLALGLLANRLGGKDMKRLEQVMDQDLVSERNEKLPELYIDDTSIVICSVGRLVNDNPKSPSSDAKLTVAPSESDYPQ